MKSELVKAGYRKPVVRVWDMKCSRVLCESQTFSVNPTEVETADRNVFGGGSYDDLY